ncbi:MAG TPA: site-2 protease family protein [Candidatus Paceibacterota bacterium]|nr:site-2 protease family protein [Candidatus Paceibacterota bacterium]
MGIEFLIGIVILIFSVILHEVMHGYVADRLGDPTARHQGRLTLNPVPHIDPVGSVLLPALLILSHTGILVGWAKPVPYNPNNLSGRYDDAKVAFAGPGMNIILAVIFGLIVRFGYTSFSPAFLLVATLVIYINLGLAIFNLIPIPPLDGSKVLFSLLPYRFRFVQNTLERYWFIGIFVLVLIFGFSGLLFPVLEFLFFVLTGHFGLALI